MRKLLRIAAVLVIGFVLGVWWDRAINPLAERARVTFVSATYATASTSGVWSYFRIVNVRHGSHVHRLAIKTACLNGEDSAAHLKLIDYNHTNAKYGCYHGGY